MFPGGKRRAIRPSVKSAHLPAPLGGLNTVSPASSMPPGDCAYCWNVLPGELGLRARMGFQEHHTGLSGFSFREVRTVIPYSGSAKNGTKDKLFAVTPDGIWDVTASSSTTKATDIEAAFSVKSGDAGYGTYAVYVTAAGPFLLYADEENGLFIYSESSEAWTQAVEAEVPAGVGQFDFDTSRVVQVAVFKTRIWLTLRDSTVARYLEAGSVSGTTEEFDFGRQFRSGGHLVGLWNWTFDGGNGLDDSLVALSSGGDVVVYQGTDPSQASTFGLKGVWYVGGLVAGRRVATDSGGEILILSRQGLVPLSRLTAGGQAQDASLYATAKIGNLFAQLAATHGSRQGWGVFIHPTDNALLVAHPSHAGSGGQQLVFSFASKSWWRYRGLPLLSAGVWQGVLYFGTADGRVCKHTGWVDESQLGSPSEFEAVEWSLLTAYQNLGRPTHKRMESLRPILLSGTPEARVEARARYGFDVNEPSDALSGNGGGGPNAWDSGLWDSAVWGGDFTPTQPTQGASGMGREVAVAVRGNAISRTTLVGVDAYFTEGAGL